MDVLVRIKRSTKKQRPYFGDDAWRPFLVIYDVEDEDELVEKVRFLLAYGKADFPYEERFPLRLYSGEELDYTIIGMRPQKYWRLVL